MPRLEGTLVLPSSVSLGHSHSFSQQIMPAMCQAVSWLWRYSGETVIDEKTSLLKRVKDFSKVTEPYKLEITSLTRRPHIFSKGTFSFVAN